MPGSDEALKKMLNRLEHIKCGVRDCAKAVKRTGKPAAKKGSQQEGSAQMIPKILNEIFALARHYFGRGQPAHPVLSD